jgi:beta-phosphoglucomutase-like phosphatase (HAD superfamily)
MTDVDFFIPGARLALELECLLLGTRNDAAQSRWWASAHEALEQWRQAVRAMEAAIDAAQPEASTTLEQADDHARICSASSEQSEKRQATTSIAELDLRDYFAARVPTVR